MNVELDIMTHGSRLVHCYHHELSNGQVLGIYFHRISSSMYNCAVTIRDTEQDCINWLDYPSMNISTGKCGLEGLVVAYRVLRWFINNKIHKGMSIRVHGTGKRGRAYQYLERLGFRACYKGQEDSLYVFEN